MAQMERRRKVSKTDPDICHKNKASKKSNPERLEKQPLQMFLKIAVLKSFTIFTGNTVLESLFIKIATLFKRDSNTGVFL